jgi:hypothetical protein
VLRVKNPASPRGYMTEERQERCEDSALEHPRYLGGGRSGLAG